MGEKLEEYLIIVDERVVAEQKIGLLSSWEAL